MPDEIDWSQTTFEGNRLRQQRELMALPFREKLRVLEHLSEVADILAKGRGDEDPAAATNVMQKRLPGPERPDKSGG